MDLEETLKKVELFSREMDQLRSIEAERQAIFLKCLDRKVTETELESRRVTDWLTHVKREEQTIQAALENTRLRFLRGEQHIKKAINRTLEAKVGLLEELQMHGDKSTHRVDMEVQLNDMRKRIEPWESI